MNREKAGLKRKVSLEGAAIRNEINASVWEQPISSLFYRRFHTPSDHFIVRERVLARIFYGNRNRMQPQTKKNINLTHK